MRFDHVGVAARDGGALADLFGTLFGASIAHRETVDGLDVTFLDLDGGSLELLEPIDDGGTIGRYLDRDGPGVHHVALATSDLTATLATARDLGVTLVDEAPRPGARGHEVAFCHPDSTGGVLVEFVEK